MAEVLRRARLRRHRRPAIEFTEPQLRGAVLAVPVPPRGLRHPPAALAAAAPQDRADPDPGRGEGRATTTWSCLGSPTWFFTTEHAAALLPEVGRGAHGAGREAVRAPTSCAGDTGTGNLNEASRLGIAQGGKYLDGVHFTYEGGQVRSLLSLLSYFGKGEMRDCSRNQDPAHQPQAGLRRSGRGVRDPAGRQRGCLDESRRVMFIIGYPLAILGVPAVAAVGATSSSSIP